MGLLSNILGDSSAAIHFEIRAAKASELHLSLGMLLTRPGTPVDAAQVDDFLRLAAMRGFDLTKLLIATCGSEILWAALPILSPGRTALMLLPPLLPPPSRMQAARALLHKAALICAADGVQLAQVLLEVDQRAVAALLLEERFQRIAELIYLFLRPRKLVVPPALQATWRWQPYDERSHALFAQTISHSYLESLDCPGLNGLRDIEDVISGHKSSGAFDPSFWFLLIDDVAAGNPQPLGVVLLNRGSRSDAAELVYLGVVPSARGRQRHPHVATVLMTQALASLPAMQAAALSLAVDASNHPALALYYRHGLHRVGSKLALIRDLRGLSASAR